MAESNQNIDIIMELKSAVLNVDWEISDETLAELSQEVAKLKSEWAGEKALLIYLQILGALCQYIGLSREKSHPGTFLLLKEVFGGLEEVVRHPEMELAEKNKDVMGYADRYNTLKSEIATGDFTPGPPEEKEEPKSTMDTLMDDDEDHSTDTVFDSMLNAMVQAPEDDEPEASSPSEDEPEEEPEPEEQKTPAPATPPARPPVQAAFNKADGTEVEPDRNEDDDFAEADDLLDDFFDDDDVPAPGVESTSDDEIFDLNELHEDEEDILDLSADDDSADNDGADGEGELVIDLEAESESEDESFQEMEDTLDDFFGDDEEGDLLEPVDKDEDDSLIDEALDDFFEDDVEGEVAETPALSLEDEDAETDADADELQLTDETAVDGGDSDSIDLSLDEPESAEDDIDVAVPEAEVTRETVSEEVVQAQETAEPDTGADASCIENLQMLLLSVEWEVDDKLLLRLQEEVESLTTLLQDEHTACLHLDFLGTVIRYVGREQADVISDSMACLKLVADSLEGFMQNKAEGSRYAADASRSFVDWHELVVVDFEKRLVEAKEAKEALEASEAVQSEHEPESPAASINSPLSDEMKAVKESILQEVRELIAQELAGSKE